LVAYKSHIRASPRLKDAELDATDANVATSTELYIQLVLIVRRMFHTCKLVHADLSEYNLLLHRNQIFVIDVSQSVEHDHPHAFDFLRSDVRNVEGFFGKAGVVGLGARRCFEFVVKESVCEKRPKRETNEEVKKEQNEGQEQDGDKEQNKQKEQGDSTESESEFETEKEALERWIRDTPTEGEEGRERELDDEVFLKSYIPRTLDQVYDPERDMDRLGEDEGSRLIYADTIGIVAPGGTKDTMKEIGKETGKEKNSDKTNGEKKGVRFEGDDDASEDGEEDGEEDDSEEDDEDGEGRSKQPRGHRNEDKDVKKVCRQGP
jgi:RIO kinase 1